MSDEVQPFPLIDACACSHSLTRVFLEGSVHYKCFFLFLGKYSEAGCTLKFILDWAWDSISNIKQAVDKVSKDIL